eukprot:1192716-Prorocentrum_minimum.AAC.1
MSTRPLLSFDARRDDPLTVVAAAVPPASKQIELTNCSLGVLGAPTDELDVVRESVVGCVLYRWCCGVLEVSDSVDQFNALKRREAEKAALEAAAAEQAAATTPPRTPKKK